MGKMGQVLDRTGGLMDSRMARAAAGDLRVCFDLGIAYAAGGDGVEVDLIEAYKWFSLAAIDGSPRAEEWRAELADEMSAREILEAQRRARAWLQLTARRAA